MALTNLSLQARLSLRSMAGDRLAPSIFVIGAQKAGTTTLHGHLGRHPQVSAPIVKEIHYYDVAYSRGRRWYDAHFPLVSESGEARLTFDTTPYYLFHPDVPRRLKRDFPNARIIALLRDPIERAWSHYWHEYARGFEKLGPLDALMAEVRRLPDPHHDAGGTREQRFAHQHFSYCARSEYHLQLANWFSEFEPEQVLCLKSEDLFSSPAATLARVAHFLGLSDFEGVKPRTLNAGGYENPSSEVRAWLEERLAPAYRATAELLGSDMTWR